MLKHMLPVCKARALLSGVPQKKTCVNSYHKIQLLILMSKEWGMGIAGNMLKEWGMRIQTDLHLSSTLHETRLNCGSCPDVHQLADGQTGYRTPI